MTPEERLRMAREHPAQYEDRVVALVYVLGWSELMRKSLFDSTALSTASEAAERMSMAGGWAEEVNQIQKDMDIGLVPDAVPSPVMWKFERRRILLGVKRSPAPCRAATKEGMRHEEIYQESAGRRG